MARTPAYTQPTIAPPSTTRFNGWARWRTPSQATAEAAALPRSGHHRVPSRSPTLTGVPLTHHRRWGSTQRVRPSEYPAATPVAPWETPREQETTMTAV